MPDDEATGSAASARQVELLEAAYAYVLQHGLSDVSLRPLAAAIGSSPRVLLFLFGSKDGLVRALLDRARTEELAMLDQLTDATDESPIGLVPATEQIWTWLANEDHRPLLRLWVEAYGRSLVESDGPWTGFASATVESWLELLATCQPVAERDTEHGAVQRTLALTVLRGALLDLLGTGQQARVTAAVHHQLAMLETDVNVSPADRPT